MVSSSIDNKLNRLLDIYIEGSISKDEYDYKRELLNVEKQELHEKLQNFNDDAEEVYVTIELLLTLVSKAKSLYQSSRIDRKRQIIKAIFSNLFINGSKLGYAIKKLLKCSSKRFFVLNGGRYKARTCDPLNVVQMLYQLS